MADIIVEFVQMVHFYLWLGIAFTLPQMQLTYHSTLHRMVVRGALL